MPASYHAARQIDPSQFIRIATKKDQGGAGIDFLIGFKKGGGSEIQSVHFDKGKFTAAQAKAWLKKHKFSVGKFEPAVKGMNEAMEYPFDKLYEMLEGALREQYPSKDGYGCQYYIRSMWTDKALLRASYAAEDETPAISLITFSVVDGDDSHSPHIELAGTPVPVQIQAVPKDGSAAVTIDEGKYEEFDEAGKRNAAGDVKTMNTVMRMLMDLMNQDDLEEETLSKMSGMTKTPVASADDTKTESRESKEDIVVEGWSALSGETITENFTTSLEESRFDKENLVIKNVKMLGSSSANGRDYPEETQKAAIPLFEGAKAYLNHARKKDAEEPRLVQEQIGYYKNVTVKDGGTYGDLHLVDKPIVREEVLPYADKKAAHLVGNSIVARAQMSKQKNGRMLVEKILAARSVDLVAEPATTTSLYEGKIITESQESVEETAMEYKDLTLDALKKERPELIEAILVLNKENEQTKIAALEEQIKERDAKLVAKEEELKTQGVALKESQEKLVAQEVAEAKRTRDELVVRVLGEAKLPESVKYEVVEGKKVFKSLFRNVVERCASEEEMRSLVADWEKTYGNTTIISEEKRLDFGTVQPNGNLHGVLHDALLN